MKQQRSRRNRTAQTLQRRKLRTLFGSYRGETYLGLFSEIWNDSCTQTSKKHWHQRIRQVEFCRRPHIYVELTPHAGGVQSRIGIQHRIPASSCQTNRRHLRAANPYQASEAIYPFVHRASVLSSIYTRIALETHSNHMYNQTLLKSL